MVGYLRFFRNAIPKGVWAVWEPAVPPHLHPDDPGLYQQVKGPHGRLHADPTRASLR
ncbi:hypothetical protein ACFQZ4_15430 [Catellatospora coxensis]|uniref:Uncharacterized protein n=1 Tax=Catellatospora coxensis TaxID=310354 RepID=A0A8J3P4H7_9ACTN|nr:hypothetical protein Cco03nite_00790 [Catellatospora coxensis]